MSSPSPRNAVKLKAKLRHALPTQFVTAIHEVRTLYWFLKDFRGQHVRTCPICNYQGRFFAYGNPPRYDAACKSCRSLERHRLIKLWLDREVKDRQLGSVLHFAPEDALIPLFRSRASKYAGADIQPGRADLVLNIEKLDLPDASVDTIVASQILEHVDDTLALQEIARVLKPGGRALLMTPVIESWNRTYENTDVKGRRSGCCILDRTIMSAISAGIFAKGSGVRAWGSANTLRSSRMSGSTVSCAAKHFSSG